VDSLTVIRNDDSTWTYVGPLADPVLCSNDLWAELEADTEHVAIEERPAGDQGQPAETFLKISATNYYLGYRLIRHTGAGYQLQLTSYSER
jgi:hypothetical protein